MRTILLAIIGAVLLAFCAFAEPPRLPNSDATSKQLPLKGAASPSACAQYGAGFVRVEGTQTCVKVGGAVSVGAGASTGSR
ncbi:MAG: hypothetical protein PS018_21475 [bacterium]|nr:hypothetical protein [bacterium]